MDKGGDSRQLRALVTGGPGRPCAVVAGLERRGFSVTAEHRSGSWGPVCLSSGPFHCYAQLPWVAHSADETGWTPDLLDARLDLLAAVASRLGPRAAVVLAVDESDAWPSGPSADLLSTLAMVILEDSGRPEVRVMTLPAAELCGPPDAEPALADGSILQGLDRAPAEMVSATG